MTRLGWILTLLVFIACIVIGLVLWNFHTPRSIPVASTATTTPADPSTVSIYTSGTYGFSFFYPVTAIVTDSFSTSTQLNSAWREHAVATGTLVAHIESLDGTVRIGVSTAKKEVSSCTTASPGEQKGIDRIIGSTTWNTFTFDRIGTDNEVTVTSYRVLHGMTCYAIESFIPRTLAGIASSTVPGVQSVIQSFTFASP